MFSKFRELYVLNSKNSLCFLFRYPRSIVHGETWTENWTSNTDKGVTDFLPALHPSLHNTTNITSTRSLSSQQNPYAQLNFAAIPALQQLLTAAYTYAFIETESNSHQNSDCILQSVNSRFINSMQWNMYFKYTSSIPHFFTTTRVDESLRLSKIQHWYLKKNHTTLICFKWIHY